MAALCCARICMEASCLQKFLFRYLQQRRLIVYRFQLFDGLRWRVFVPTRDRNLYSCQELSRVSINCAGNFVEYIETLMT